MPSEILLFNIPNGGKEWRSIKWDFTGWTSCLNSPYMDKGLDRFGGGIVAVVLLSWGGGEGYDNGSGKASALCGHYLFQRITTCQMNPQYPFIMQQQWQKKQLWICPVTTSSGLQSCPGYRSTTIIRLNHCFPFCWPGAEGGHLPPTQLVPLTQVLLLYTVHLWPSDSNVGRPWSYGEPVLYMQHIALIGLIKRTSIFLKKQKELVMNLKWEKNPHLSNMFFSHNPNPRIQKSAKTCIIEKIFKQATF